LTIFSVIWSNVGLRDKHSDPEALPPSWMTAVQTAATTTGEWCTLLTGGVETCGEHGAAGCPQRDDNLSLPQAIEARGWHRSTSAGSGSAAIPIVASSPTLAKPRSGAPASPSR
jgi:hypothetical protein